MEPRVVELGLVRAEKGLKGGLSSYMLATFF